MTADIHGQGLIDFSQVFSPHRAPSGARRRKLKPEECVSAEKIRELNIVREKSGFNCKEVADSAGLTNNFVYRALHELQGISIEDYRKIFCGLAELVFRKVREA